MRNYTPQSLDTALLEGCLQKDRLAQKYLYQRYYGKMLSIAMRYAGHKEEAVDILNRAFLKVFDKLETYTESGSLSGWIATIVFNTSIDYVRSRTKYKSVMDFNVEKDVMLSETIIEQLYAEDLLLEIQKLPAAMRSVFSLYVIDGYKHREISEMLNININTSKWHLAEAKKDLRKRLQSFECEISNPEFSINGNNRVLKWKLG